MMYCKCDGCGQEAPAVFNGHVWTPPAGWREKVNHRIAFGREPTVIQVCSLGCIDGAEKKLQFIRLGNDVENGNKTA